MEKQNEKATFFFLKVAFSFLKLLCRCTCLKLPKLKVFQIF